MKKRIVTAIVAIVLSLVCVASLSAEPAVRLDSLSDGDYVLDAYSFVGSSVMSVMERASGSSFFIELSTEYLDEDGFLVESSSLYKAVDIDCVPDMRYSSDDFIRGYSIYLISAIDEAEMHENMHIEGYAIVSRSGSRLAFLPGMYFSLDESISSSYVPSALAGTAWKAFY